MTEFELLGRGSAFLTPWVGEGGAGRLHVVAPGHVTHPWRFRHFAALAGPELDWLEAVREEAVRVTLSVREQSSGKTLLEVPLAAGGAVHDEADLSVWRIGRGEDEERLAELGVAAVELAREGSEGREGEAVVLVGHETHGDRLVPCALNGRVAGEQKGKVVAVKTEGATAQMGLCGGPALMQSGKEGVSTAGMVFARVDAKGPLHNHTLLVSAATIRSFLQNQVEKKQ